MIRILVVTDVRLYRDGLVLHLGRQPEMDVVGAAANRPETLEANRTLQPDVILLDMAMAESRATIGALRSASPSVKVIVLAVGDSDLDVLACAESGAAGYVVRDGSMDDLTATVMSVARGELRCSPRAAATLLRRVFALASERGLNASVGETLTLREREIVRLVDRGMSNKEIAARLGIELPTVKNHIHHILDKLQVRRRAEIGSASRAMRSDGVSGMRLHDGKQREPSRPDGWSHGS
jgi:DNA-binding NarL/FixJ family response regulator